MKTKRFRIVPDNISGCKVQRWYWFLGWIDMDDEGFINTFKSVDDAVKALESYLTNNKGSLAGKGQKWQSEDIKSETMNRKDFFKKLGAGAIVAAVAPKVLADIKPGKVGPHGIPFVDVSRIPDGMTLEEVLRIYNETGTLVYQTTTPADMTGRIIAIHPSSTPLDSILRERRRGYDLSEY